MRKHSFILITIMIMILILSVVPVSASSPPAEVMFEVQTTIPPEGGPNFGPFVATGPAVDEGVVCATGDTIDVYIRASGFQSGRGVNYQVVKLFICDDGSGEFFVKLQVRVDQKGNNYNWNVVGGTGSYDELHGTGTGFGLSISEGVFDIFDGKLHID